MSTDLHDRLNDAFATGATMPLSPDPAWRRGRRQARLRTAVTSVGSLGIAALAIAGIAAVSGPSTNDVVGFGGAPSSDDAFVATEDADPDGLVARFADEERGAVAMTVEAPITQGVIAVARIDVGHDGEEGVLLASGGDLSSQSRTIGSAPAPSAGEHVLRHELRQCPPAGCSTVGINAIDDLVLLSSPCEQIITTAAGEVTPIKVRWNAAEPASCGTVTFSAPEAGTVRLVPDVDGLDINIAERRLIMLGYEVDRVAVPARGRLAGETVAQSAIPGTPMPLAELAFGRVDDDFASDAAGVGRAVEAAGIPIDLRPSITLEYADDTATYRDPVSDVVGMTADQARERLATDGYIIQYVYAYPGSAALAEDGEVIAQDVEPGRIREVSSTVTVTVARR